MKKILTLLIISALVIGLLLSGCATKKVVTETETPAAEEKPAEEKKAEEATEADVSPEQGEVSSQDIARSGDYEKVAAIDVSKIKDIYFDFDRYDIKSDSKSMLMELSDILINNVNSRVLIEGHCDERGTNQYNVALGDRRAASTRDYLIASGVSPSKIETVSYGEEKPQCSEQKESCWSINRRAHFVISGIRN